MKGKGVKWLFTSNNIDLRKRVGLLRNNKKRKPWQDPLLDFLPKLLCWL